MPRKPNEIAVQWLESKDTGKRHCVNVKYVIGKLQLAARSVKLNTRHYHTAVVDLLDWAPPQRKRKAASSHRKEIYKGMLPT